jgi:hypothetical protein
MSTSDFPQTSDDRVPAYTAASPPRPSADELRARIPGWGVDLDPADRPSYPKLQEGIETGAHWSFPTRQGHDQRRERSVEHRFLTPAYGTAQPLRGLSGALRRAAYARWSEGRMAHWLTLIAADRVDVYESAVRDLFRGRPANLVAETGVVAELTHHGLASRAETRSDTVHHLMDPVVVAGPWVAAAGAGVLAGRAVWRRVRS